MVQSLLIGGRVCNQVFEGRLKSFKGGVSGLEGLFQVTSFKLSLH